MKKNWFPAFAFSLLLFSCNDNTDKVADGMCNCYSESSVKFSSATKKILNKVSESKNPLKTYKAEVEKLDEDEKTKVNQEMQQASAVSDDEDMKACVAKVDEKYKVRGTDQTAALKKVMQHMKEKGGSCQAWAGLMNLGLQAQDKTASKDDEGTDETEKPKKKKETTDDEK